MISTVIPADRGSQRVRADPSRVISRLFVPGQEGFEQQDSRSGVVVARVLALDDRQVLRALDDVITRFSGRHRDLVGTFRRHARELADRIEPGIAISDARMVLLGAVFTNEYAIEGAAVCNPSIVPHPDQTGLVEGSTRFVMSVRGIGEGHRSSIGFRTGVIDSGARPVLDPPPSLATVGTTASTPLDADVVRVELAHLVDAGEAGRDILSSLAPQFTRADLDERLAGFRTRLRTRGHAQKTINAIEQIAQRFYGVEFADDVPLEERVLWPAMHAESAGMEDARFVRFVDDDGSVTFLASYTAYSGTHISQQLLTTTDFRSFTSKPMVGRAAANKGLALFPRRIGGRFAALSRADRETNAIAFSDRPDVWPTAQEIQRPVESWELVQLGNCGPPIETEAGWLVLTHGVGAMRTYHIGALLLDLDDPTRLIGRLAEPLLSPAPDERDGYVPNVVYSCGAMRHGDTLVLPYGIADSEIGFATVALPELLTALTTRTS